MKKLVFGIAAAAALMIAVPAMAHDDDDDYGYNVDSYDQMMRLDQHIRQGIQHGLSDGSFTRGEARYFWRQLQNIRYRAQWEEEWGEFDAQDISYRLHALHERMHEAHEEGHERMDNDWNYR